MSNLTQELQTELDNEAKAEAKKLTGRVPIFRMGYEAGYYDGVEKYALKWQQAEAKADRYEKALKEIQSHIKSAHNTSSSVNEMAIALIIAEALTP